ncbi:MAG: putative DNA modification/repair radical SAM protein [Cellvibrio sp.]
MANVLEKLTILSDAAKYDASCSSSGSKRANKEKGIGNSDGMGICHSYTEDGRCVSLLKILFTNVCMYDCAYCVSRSSNDVKRASFTVDEVVELTLNFYRRNFIEGLFLSSGIVKSSDATMEKLVRVAKKLRTEHKFNGYIHLKAIPGSSPELLHEAGLYADRLSVNIEIPSEMSLKKVAPEKNYSDIITPMNFLTEEKIRLIDEKKTIKRAPIFMPAGQSTQLIVGASPESDWQILRLADDLYKGQKLKRVYYSGYVPIKTDNRVPLLDAPPLLRENRIYQADWLLRFYKFSLDEIITPDAPDLDLEVDPKVGYALRNPHLFPVDINKADYEAILRVPGIGVKSAKKLVSARRFQRITWDNLKALGIAAKRAQYFIECPGLPHRHQNTAPEILRQKLISPSHPAVTPQMSLFG